MPDEPSPAPADGGRVLRKDLTTFSLTALIMGAMIGSGIFFLPGTMLRDSGGGVWPVMVAWIFGALIAMSGGLVFAELGAAFPKEGGQYAFLRDSLGKAWGFLFSWASFTVLQTATIAAVAIAMANAVDGLVDLPGTRPCLGNEFDDAGELVCNGLRLPKWGVGFTAIAVVALLTFVNHLGVKRGAWVNNGATVAKVGALVLIAGVAFGGGGSGAGNFSSGGWGGVTVNGFLLAMSASLFAYDGFAQATFVAAEVKDARKALPKAIVLATTLVAAIYLTATFAIFHVVPLAEITAGALDGDEPIATQAMDIVLGGAAATLVLLAIIVSTFGTVNTYVLTSPRIYHPIARDGEFPSAFGVLSKHGTPTYGLVYGAVWAGILTMTGSYDALANLVVFGLYVFYLATMVGYFVLRRSDPGAFADAGFRMPLRPVPAVFFSVAAVAVLASYVVDDVGLLVDGQLGSFFVSTTVLGVILIGTGGFAYWMQHHGKTRASR
ncbi:MAG: APC family permease [Candidatus Thermoplasmatota archaeon]